MVARIYLWKSSGAKSFGHISLELSDKTYVSWWPSENIKSVVAGVAGTPAKWFDDFDTELNECRHPEKTFNVLGLNEDKIKVYYKRLLDGSKKWDFMTRSCSSVIYSALCEGSDWFKDRAGQTTTPEAVADLVEAKQTRERLDKLQAFFTID